jgi:hypothetical protein
VGLEQPAVQKPDHPIEWNHCQPTRVKIILAEDPLRATVTADGPIKLEGMFEVGTSIIDPPSRTASELSDLIAKVQEARLHRKQEAISQPRQSAPVTGVASKSGDAHLSAFDHAGFKRLTRAQPTASAIATAGPKIISVQEGR